MANNAAKALYLAWRNAGLSDNQARIMMAETGRENGWNLNTIFVGHPEPVDVARGVANPRRNFGLISWNGDRRTNLINNLSRQGLWQNGQAVKSQATLNAMAKFAVSEMANNPRYAATKRIFLANPNVDYGTATKVLGKNYIAWRYDDPAYASGHRNRDKFYSNINKALGGGGQNIQGNFIQEQPQRDPLLDLDSPSLIKALRKKNPKMSDTEVFANLINGNGLAGQEMRQLLESDGRDPMEVASMLGLKRVKLSMPTPQEPQAIEQPQVDEPQQTASDTPQYKPVSIDSVKQLIPSLKEQGMNDYQALYHLAQGNDDIGRNIRETYKRGVGLHEMAGMFGLNFGDVQDMAQQPQM